ncbi:fatty-acyl-CoA synthase/long-chain acyl-CoA synthetase [Litoreibacter meonggei]|uniref:Fatty-acyl-CoA synthase/long-chain acyl-CoA synthetase n=1 Tax=Litoreibacter meonggei TaxID=1049199 RepID=A0A497WRE4_9RHOB|nr:acyl-CoA synthetase [Litoreibacter meonggei]RLJ59210.1 fatty-acyl-CoA synthase/long-chain acyl-CoA synthetase [Litoreibacter meonggei]
MGNFATKADRDAIQAESAWEDRNLPRTMYQFLTTTKDKFGKRNAFSYQLTSGPTDKNETLTWDELHGKCCQAANLFRSLGVGEDDVVAYVLPNASETAYTLLGGSIAGIVNPINPLLEPEQISAILRETGAKVVVTLKAFPKTDLAQKVAEAVGHAPNVKHVLEIDLLRYLTGLKKFIVPFIRPKVHAVHHAKVLDFCAELNKQPTSLAFEDSAGDRVAFYFHTGGTTGMPKVAQHKYSGVVYNGWLGRKLLFTEEDVLMCPLPLFHVFASHVVLMSVIASGAHVIFPTPQGYRGDGVFDNFWKLIERYKVTFMITVPTAISALMQRPVDADISSLNIAFSGSSPLPVELYNRFEKACGVTIVEGYGLTEATCLVSINPPSGEKKVGSIGIPFPYTDVTIRRVADGSVCDVDEIGEICLHNPGVYEGHTYTEADKNVDLYYDDKYLRTGDLGRLDADGYLWITGRAKDLIIRGGHNIDPAEIEEALAGHPDVGFAGAIGQPDAHAGEIPCVYVELVDGGTATIDELMAFAKEKVHERAAHPRYIELMDELPKTAVGKIFKPELRKMAITRIYNQALKKADVAAEVVSVAEDKKRGLVAKVAKRGDVTKDAVNHVLGSFTRPWEWVD